MKAKVQRRGMIVVDARRADPDADPAVRAFRQGIGNTYEPSAESAAALAEDAKSRGADLLLFLYELDVSFDRHTSGPFEESAPHPLSPIAYKFFFEIGLVGSDGSLLYHDDVMGRGAQILFSVKAAHERAVANAIENVAEALAGE